MKLTVQKSTIAPEALKSLPIDEIRRLNAMVDGVESASIGAVIEVAPPQAAPAPDVGSMEDLLSEYGNEDLVIHERVIAGKKWGVKEHDMYSLLDLETRRLSVVRGQISRDPSREVKLGLAMELQTSLYKRAGEEWQPFFTNLDQCQQFLRKPHVKKLIDELAAAVWDVNPSLDPMRKMAAANSANE